MTFSEQLADYSAAQIVAALGCPRQTAYAWLDGSRKPPEWQQTLFLAVIAKESKKHTQRPACNAEEAGWQGRAVGRRA